MCATFSLILEAMTYLMLDYYNKIKKFDRLIGYIAMVHKDMELEGTDMNVHNCTFLNLIKKRFFY